MRTRSRVALIISVTLSAKGIFAIEELFATDLASTSTRLSWRGFGGRKILISFSVITRRRAQGLLSAKFVPSPAPNTRVEIV